MGEGRKAAIVPTVLTRIVYSKILLGWNWLSTRASSMHYLSGPLAMDSFFSTTRLLFSTGGKPNYINKSCLDEQNSNEKYRKIIKNVRCLIVKFEKLLLADMIETTIP